jgi:uncharacterized protein
MFLEFSVENFRSIADRQTLRLVASKRRTEAVDQPAVDEPGFTAGKVLTSAVIYGANASGKSNFLYALNTFVRLITTSAEPKAPWYIEPFRLDPIWTQRPSRFEVSFLKDGIRYQYGCALDRSRIHEEWLLAYPKKTPQLWFERRADGEKVACHFGPSMRGEKARLASMTRPDALFLSVAAQFNHAQLSDLQKWLTTQIRSQRAQGFGPLGTAEILESSSSFQSAVGRLLQGADLGILGVDVRRHPKRPDAQSGVKNVIRTGKEDEHIEVITKHRGADGSLVSFDLLDDESEGTVRFFELIRPITATLGSGGLLAVDELDQSLHPLLVRRLVSLFHNPTTNPLRAQLVFNTHDTTLLDPKLFRRDQVWFTEKDKAGKTHLYSLLEYSPRKEEALQRGYLLGRYGAIPFIGELNFQVKRSDGSDDGEAIPMTGQSST